MLRSEQRASAGVEWLQRELERVWHASSERFSGGPHRLRVMLDTLSAAAG